MKNTFNKFPILKVQISKLYFLAIIAFSFSAKAQKVYSAQYANQADVKVFITEYANIADLKVYRVDHSNQAGKNNGNWFFTDYENQAEKKIFFTQYENQADLKIFYVEYANQAGWNDDSKKKFFE